MSNSIDGPILGDEWIDAQWEQSCAQELLPALTHFTAAVERACGARLRAENDALRQALGDMRAERNGALSNLGEARTENEKLRSALVGLLASVVLHADLDP